jgi:hypothetical protein
VESSIHKQQERLHEYIYKTLPRPIGLYCRIGGGNAGSATGVTDSCAPQLADANKKINELTQKLDLEIYKNGITELISGDVKLINTIKCINTANNINEVNNCKTLSHKTLVG